MAGSGEAVAGAARTSRGWSIAAGVLLIVVGMEALAAPYLAALFATFWVGWGLVFGGVAELISAWSSGENRPWKVLLGVLYLAVGFYMLERSQSGARRPGADPGLGVPGEGRDQRLRRAPAPSAGWLGLVAVRRHRHSAPRVPDLLRLAARFGAHHRLAGRDQPHPERREPPRLGFLALRNTAVRASQRRDRAALGEPGAVPA